VCVPVNVWSTCFPMTSLTLICHISSARNNLKYCIGKNMIRTYVFIITRNTLKIIPQHTACKSKQTVLTSRKRRKTTTCRRWTYTTLTVTSVVWNLSRASMSEKGTSIGHVFINTECEIITKVPYRNWRTVSGPNSSHSHACSVCAKCRENDQK